MFCLFLYVTVLYHCSHAVSKTGRGERVCYRRSIDISSQEGKYGEKADSPSSPLSFLPSYSLPLTFHSFVNRSFKVVDIPRHYLSQLLSTPFSVLCCVVSLSYFLFSNFFCYFYFIRKFWIVLFRMAQRDENDIKLKTRFGGQVKFN